MKSRQAKTYYAVVLNNGETCSDRDSRFHQCSAACSAGSGLRAYCKPGPGTVQLSWQPIELQGTGYRVFRAPMESDNFEPLNDELIMYASYVDAVMSEHDKADAMPHLALPVCAVNRRGVCGPASPIVEASAGYVPMNPVFETSSDSPDSVDPAAAIGLLQDTLQPLKATLHSGAKYGDGRV